MAATERIISEFDFDAASIGAVYEFSRSFSMSKVVRMLVCGFEEYSPESFAGDGYTAGTMLDADKIWQGDSGLCWLASAANMVAYAGWTEDVYDFREYQLHELAQRLYEEWTGIFENEGYWQGAAVSWFFTGDDQAGRWTREAGCSRPLSGTGGWRPDVPLRRVLSEPLFGQEATAATLDELAGMLRRGYAAGIEIVVYKSLSNAVLGRQNAGGHALTCWGVGYGEDGAVNGLLVADPDDRDSGRIVFCPVEGCAQSVPGREDGAPGAAVLHVKTKANEYWAVPTAADYLAPKDGMAPLLLASGTRILHPDPEGEIIAGAEETLAVFSGGAASGARVLEGGRLAVHAGGSAFMAEGMSGGTVLVRGAVLDASTQAGCTQTVLSGGRASGGTAAGLQRVFSGGRASGVQLVSGGLQILYAGGSAARSQIGQGGTVCVRDGARLAKASVASGGLAIVSAGGEAVSASVSSGGRIAVQSGGILSAALLHPGASLYAFEDAMLEGANRLSGCAVSGSARLAPDAALSAGSGTNMSRLFLDAGDGGTLAAAGAGIRLGTLYAGPEARVSFSLSGTAPSASGPMLTVREHHGEALSFMTVEAGPAQAPGTYRLAAGLNLRPGLQCTVSAGGMEAGQAEAGGPALKAAGMSWRLESGGRQTVLKTEALPGWMKRGNGFGNVLSGSENGDVFWGGDGGNDRISGCGGRDCAVWGQENWGRDAVAATSGTMAIVFDGLSESDVVQRRAGRSMVFARAGDEAQKIVVSGWNAETHSAVFADGLSAFGEWAHAASPVLAQAKAARTEVWKAAGLAAQA